MQLGGRAPAAVRPILPVLQSGNTHLARRPFIAKSRPEHAKHGSSISNTRKRDCRAVQTEIEITTEEVLDINADPLEALRTDTPFDWGKQWYAVAVSKYIDNSKPYPVQVLGKRLVLWVDGTGAWRCFEDRCPHRAAPLSEGKVLLDKNTIQCSYHGWQFGTQGDCVRVPQAASEDAERVACSSPKACARVYPVAEAQGMLFIWGESGPEAEAESAAKPLPVCKLLQGATGEQREPRCTVQTSRANPQCRQVKLF